MKKLFWTGLLVISVFEILKVYFIMPMPGSQQLNSLGVAYFLHSSRWFIRIICGLMIAAGFRQVFQSRYKWIPVIALLIVAGIVYIFNFIMSADKMFLQPHQLILKPKSGNKLPGESLVIGIENNGDAKAYPIRFLAYHHQVQDVIGGKPVIVTYCSVCRSGRVFEPVIKGRIEKFRLVGMDHFNAMFEDASTKSWWRQENGEAVTGELKGTFLPEMTAQQISLRTWLELYPHSYIMQPDEASLLNYDSLARFEQGKSAGDLTRTDTQSWNEKSWVIGIQAGNIEKAYDWNLLKTEHIINDSPGNIPLVIAMASDRQSFAAFERPSDEPFTLSNDTLFSGRDAYNFAGQHLGGKSQRLKRIKAYQEFWHSWRTFHPRTLK